MKVDTTNPLYKKYEKDWKLIADLIAGERAIKAAGEIYLPKLSGQTESDYAKYVQRGCLFNAMARTLQGMVGAVVRTNAVIEAPPQLQPVLEDATVFQQTIQEVIRDTVDNILSYGFLGILIDMPTNTTLTPALPYLALYKGVDILNWQRVKIGDDEVLSMVVLSELRYKIDPQDPYIMMQEKIIRVCFIDVDGWYKQRVFIRNTADPKNEDWIQEGEDIIPTKVGIPFKEIPFVFFNSLGIYPAPTKPPLLDVANLNIKHWQVSTDYYHGLHYCAIPTPWAAGFRVDGDLYIGSQKAWVSDDPNAKCGYLEFTGTGLAAIEKALTKLETLMAVMGARLLEEQKAGVESAEAIRLRISGDSVTLSTVAQVTEEGIVQVLDFVCLWMGISGKVKVSINRDFVSQRLSSSDITALLGAVQAGKISMDTFLYNLRVGEILPPDRTIEDEKDMIASEAPDLSIVDPNTNPGFRF